MAFIASWTDDVVVSAKLYNMLNAATSTAIKPMLIQNALHWRHATKEFDKTRIVPKEKFDLLLESLRLSPSSLDLQPWKFLIIENEAVRKQMRLLGMNQPQITDASHLVLLCSRNSVDASYFDHLIQLEKRTMQGNSVLEHFKPLAMSFIEAQGKEQLRESLAEQVYIALGFLLLSCAMMHIDACPIEAFDHGKVNKLLGLHELGFESRILVAIGYRPEKDQSIEQPKIRWPREEVIVTI